MNVSENKRIRTNTLNPIVYGKIPPQHKDLEEVILGALMLDPECVYIAMSKLFPDIFYVNHHQKVFSAIQNLYDHNQRIDMLTVVAQLQKCGNLEDAGGIHGILKLTNSVVSGANIETHILIISQDYMKRESIRLGMELVDNAFDDTVDSFDIITSADIGFQKIQERIITGNAKTTAFFGMKVLDQHAQVKETGVLGITTGFNTLNAVLCGLVAPDLIILAARPGQGKTAFALSITYYTAVLLKIPCAWFSLEMDGVQLVRRLASIDSGLNHESIRKGDTTKEEDTLLGKSIDRISESPIFIEDKSGINVRDIRTKSHLLKKKNGIKFIVVDYLQLMKGTDVTNKSRENIVSEISRSLKELAKELEIPIIALSQLSREVEKRSDKMPQLSDLRESGGIEQDADEVIFLMRPEYYGMMNSVEIGGKEYDPVGLTIVSIAKNRHGATKNVALDFYGKCMKFSDHPNDNHHKNYNVPDKISDKDYF